MGKKKRSYPKTVYVKLEDGYDTFYTDDYLQGVKNNAKVGVYQFVEEKTVKTTVELE